jgi:hypothetical protein
MLQYLVTWYSMYYDNSSIEVYKSAQLLCTVHVHKFVVHVLYGMVGGISVQANRLPQPDNPALTACGYGVGQVLFMQLCSYVRGCVLGNGQLRTCLLAAHDLGAGGRVVFMQLCTV